MIAGALSAIAVSLCSGRADWQRRVAYFAFFGGLGWGFGGSISYMYPLAFTESGQTLSTYYGYFATFFEGGLWCGMGAAGTALAATLNEDRLTRFFKPLLFVLAAMGLRHFLETPLEELLAPAGAGTGDEVWHRHESPLYWFDADWLPALLALIGVWTYEWVDRFKQADRRVVDQPWMLPVFLLAGGVLGNLLQRFIRIAGLEAGLAERLVVKLGDLSYVHPETGESFDEDQLLTNWPQFFSDYPDHLGAGLGVLLAAAVWFWQTGRFRNDARLLVYLAAGWLIAFIALPTLGSTVLMDYGGLRMMPPRSDDWAGILGVFVAGLCWAWRHDARPVAHVMSVGFLLGGMAFATVPFLRYLARYPGHPWRFPEGVPEAWTHYHSANWHSILEQLHGFGHGLAIAAAMGLLLRRLPVHTETPPTRRWTGVFAATFTLFGFGYLNLHKNVGTWVGNGAVPATMRAPLVEAIELPALYWFAAVWLAAAVVGIILLTVHCRRPLDILPPSWIGKGQLLYVLFLWVMVIGNLMRAIPGYTENRMVTEWVLLINACLATLLIALLPHAPSGQFVKVTLPGWSSLRATWLCGLLVAACLMSGYGAATLALYQDHLEGTGYANHRRFGPDATWRTRPILKHGEHP